MRVTLGRQRRDDRGAVLVLVAVFAVVAVVFMAFVVDIGNQRQSRRQIATASDSVALAVARDWANSGLAAGFDCEDTTVDERLGAYNNPVKNAAADPVCTFDRTNAPLQGSITVTDEEGVDYAFGGVTGVQQGSTGAATTVAIGTVPGGGLRPVGLCLLDPDISQWVAAEEDPALKSSPTYDPGPFDIFLPKFLDPLCTDGNSPGNWGQLILPGAGTGAAEFRDDVENGAAEDVSVNDEIPNYTGGGGLNSADAEFEALEGTIFTLPLYSFADRGNGSDVTYPIAGFLEVRLLSSTLNGQNLSFLIQPLRVQQSGMCCFVNEYNAELTVCDVGTLAAQPSASVTTNCRATLSSVTPTSMAPPSVPDCAVSSITYKHEPKLATGKKSVGELQNDLDVTAKMTDVSTCGSLTMVIVTSTDLVKTDFDSVTLSGSELRALEGKAVSAPWTSGTYRTQVLEDGVLLGEDTFTL